MIRLSDQAMTSITRCSLFDLIGPLTVSNISADAHILIVGVKLIALL